MSGNFKSTVALPFASVLTDGAKIARAAKFRRSCIIGREFSGSFPPANPSIDICAPSGLFPLVAICVGKAGVAIGAITGDAGTGAAVGAVAGGLAGRRAGKQAQAQNNQQSKAAASNTEKEIKDTFIKGFSACLEGKGYTIK